MAKYSRAMQRYALNQHDSEEEAPVAQSVPQQKPHTASPREGASVAGGRNGAAPRAVERVWPFLLTPELRDGYLQLNRTILLAAGESGLKTVIFTSCEENRERALVIAEFAALVAADLGRKVLLADGDYHRRYLSEILGRSEYGRLHDSLVFNNGGKGALLDPQCPGLAFLPSGARQSETVLHPHVLQDWLQEMRESFDYVLIDTPPLSQSADSAILGKYADGVIIVAQAERTDRALLTRAKEQMENSHCRILGVVLTQTREYLPPFFRRYAGFTL